MLLVYLHICNYITYIQKKGFFSFATKFNPKLIHSVLYKYLL